MSNRLKQAEERKPCNAARIMSINQALHGHYDCPIKGKIYVPLDCRRKRCPMLKKERR